MAQQSDDVALIEVTTDAGQRQTITASGGFRDVTAAFGDAKFACGG